LSDLAGRILYVEPFSGISGDMFIGALLDLGIGLARLEEKLLALPLRGYRLGLTRCNRAGIEAAKFRVECDGHGGDQHPHRDFRGIRDLIESSGLSEWAKRKSVAAFHKLAAAEGEIHGCLPEAVHFHEVGAVDSIVDMVGAVVLVEELLPVRLASAAVNVGQGALECRHGIYPAPGPAAIALLKGIPIYSNSIRGELTTPTGAALLSVLAEDFGPRPLMRVSKVGYGAGDREIAGAANVLRLTVGDGISEAAVEGEVAVIEATLDDMNPQMYGYFQEKILAAGALDVYAVSAQMKKNRPGLLLTVVCDGARVDEMASLIFSETTTIGLRHTVASRKTLAREWLDVQTEYGIVTVKVALRDGRRMNFAPEFESCRSVAMTSGAPLKDVIAAATRAFLELESEKPRIAGHA
jgi:uncharacterized protein (TIGR00299 family) protein